jgi:hypothetical protein
MNQQQHNKIYPRIIGNDWEPTDKNKPWLQYIDEWYCKLNNTIDSIAFTKTKQLNYIDKEVLHALKQLANMKDIVIKPADKNLGPVILTRRQYETMCMEHLNNTNTYQLIDNFNPNICYNELEQILERNNMRYIQYGNNPNKKQQSETKLAKSICQLKNSSLLRQSYFYCNPKMHKPGLIKKGRPIVSSINSITYHTSIYLHNILSPIMKHLISTVPSSQAALLRMQNITLPNNSMILCADVTSLYPSIPIEYGLSAVHRMLELVTQRKLMTINIPLIMALLKWVLTNNYFTFNNKTYKQLTGTAMGTPVAPVYANIVLFWIDVKCCENQVPIYMRYLDDIFIIVNNIQHGLNTVQTFNQQCNTLQLEAVTIGQSGIFLDLSVTIRDNKLVIKVYQKSINKYLYLKPSTNHARNVLENFLLQEFTRYKLICTEENEYNKIAQQFTKRLQNRSYNVRYIVSNILPKVPTKEQIMAKILQNSSKSRSDMSLPIIIMRQLVKYHLHKNGYSPKHILTIPEQISQQFEFVTAYPNFSSKGVLFGKTNEKSVRQYIVRAEYPKPDPQMAKPANKTN